MINFGYFWAYRQIDIWIILINNERSLGAQITGGRTTLRLSSRLSCVFVFLWHIWSVLPCRSQRYRFLGVGPVPGAVRNVRAGGRLTLEFLGLRLTNIFMYLLGKFLESFDNKYCIPVHRHFFFVLENCENWYWVVSSCQKVGVADGSCFVPVLIFFRVREADFTPINVTVNVDGCALASLNIAQVNCTFLVTSKVKSGSKMRTFMQAPVCFVKNVIYTKIDDVRAPVHNRISSLFSSHFVDSREERSDQKSEKWLPDRWKCIN